MNINLENNAAIKIISVQILLCAITSPISLIEIAPKLKTYFKDNFKLEESDVISVLKTESNFALDEICESINLKDEGKALLGLKTSSFFDSIFDTETSIKKANDLLAINSLSGIFGVLAEIPLATSLKDFFVEYLLRPVASKEVVSLCRVIDSIFEEGDVDFSLIDESLGEIQNKLFLGIELNDNTVNDSKLLILSNFPNFNSKEFSLKLGYVYKTMEMRYSKGETL